jgi:hypothetical protein
MKEWVVSLRILSKPKDHYVVVGLLLFLSVPIAAKTIYVSESGSDANSGLSWQQAKRTVNGALAVAENGDEIWVAKGTYRERMQIERDLELYGGFKGDEAALSERPSFPRPLFDPVQSVIDGANVGTVITVSTGVRSRIDGFVIRGGRGTVGGIWCRASQCSIVNNTIRCNEGIFGGGIYCEESSPTIADNVIENNISQKGGGIGLHRSSSIVVGNVIRRNNAMMGGGMYCSMSSPLIAHNLITGNFGRDGAAAMAIDGGSPTLDVNFISANFSNQNVISIQDASPLLTNTIIVANGHGTAVSASGLESNFRIINSTIAFNESYGVYFDNGAVMEVGNCIIAHNGGTGISRGLRSARLKLYSSCFYDNLGGAYLPRPGDDINDESLLFAPPMLVGTNCHLLPDSPCIDRGNNEVVQPGMDIDGESRVYNERVDIGADEFIPPTVNGVLYLNDYEAYDCLQVDFEIRTARGTEKRTVPIRRDGLSHDAYAACFTVPQAPSEPIDISVQPRTWLRRTLKVDVSSGTVVNLSIALVNGDVDGDNEITLFDFGVLTSAFGTSPCDTDWVPSADLDGDDEVTLFDYGIVVNNFGKIGDE